jgi:hypothetical protein
VVLLVHAALLGLWPAAAGPGGPGSSARPVQVRQIARARASPPAAAGAAARPSPAAAPARAAPPAPRPRTPPAIEPAAGQAETPRAAAIAPPGAVHEHVQAQADDTPAAAAAADPGGLAVPVYATSLPPSTTLRYLRQRGAQQGRVSLRWEVQGDQYQLSLNSEASSGPAIGSSSRGSIGEQGLAPDRHTESRRGRDVRAANFQRDSARITFSGPRTEYPLLPGSQDRLSWMLQLGAIVEANPALRAPGSEIAMFVVGGRGDGELWVFTVQGRADVELPAGPVSAALHLKREARRPYDTQAEVWLDPARMHLPVRLRLVVRPTGEGSEFLLESAAIP